jgi:hypothetical protein
MIVSDDAGADGAASVRQVQPEYDNTTNRPRRLEIKGIEPRISQRGQPQPN